MDLRNMHCGANGCARTTTSKLWSTARILTAILLAFSFCTVSIAPALAQTASHQAVLSWPAPSDATTSSSYNVYRANATCPTSGLGTLTWTKLTTTPIAALTYTDNSIGVGNWCYYVTQLQQGAESVPSNTAGGQARPNTVTIQIVVN